jgi:hypothetical protein
MRSIFSTLILLFFSALFANWVDIRQSALTPDAEVIIRYESVLTDNYDHQLSYYSSEGWMTLDAVSLGGDSYQSAVPFDNIAEIPLSFRISNGTTNIIPGFTNVQPTSLSQMTPMPSYVRNTALSAHLNISGERTLFSDDYLYFALSNFGGGFPVSGGLFGPFYSYTVSVWPQTTGNPLYVYALVYTVNAEPLINPGLYKINTATEELIQIGNITTQVVSDTNTLYISCLMSDLLDDDDFSSAYSSDIPLNAVAMTQTISNFGNTITLNDEGNYHLILLEKQAIESGPNTLPELTNIEFTITDGLTEVSLVYFDSDGNFPLIAEIDLDNGPIYDFQPSGNNFQDPVNFSAQFYDEWELATIRFSDNTIDYVEMLISNLKPQAPQNITISISDSNITISWDEVNTDTGNNPIIIDHYKVLYSTENPHPDAFQVLDTTTETEFIHYQATEEYSKIFYKVKAVSGNRVRQD